MPQPGFIFYGQARAYHLIERNGQGLSLMAWVGLAANDNRVVLLDYAGTVEFAVGDDPRWFEVARTNHSFRVGDRVRVRGEVRHRCASICMQGDGCIEVHAIERCTTRSRP